jgi:hypothetical protein
MTKRDQILLLKILNYQNLLKSTVKELRISSHGDLSSIHAMMRRGMVQTVADIFELTVPLSDETLKQLPLNLDIIKQFRNTASHNYGKITNELAYACITHCVDKLFMDAVKKLLGES